MKIKLYAFGKMESGIMDVPENTSNKFELVLTQPLTAFFDERGDKYFENPPFDTRAIFEWEGRYDGETHARIYNLTDITKLN